MTLRDIKDALASLPKELDDVYEKVLGRIRNQGNGHDCYAMNILKWMLHAGGPLRLVEIQHALAVRIGDTFFDKDGIINTENLFAVCAGIVALGENDTVRFVHYTTQEYFKGRAQELFPDAHATIAHVCITYLSFDVFGQGPCNDDKLFEERLLKYPLLPYAATLWSFHGRIAQVMEPALAFLQEEAKLMASLQVVHARKAHTPGYSQAFVKYVDSHWRSSTSSLSWVIFHLLGFEPDDEIIDSKRQRLLHRVRMEDFTAVARHLIDRGIKGQCERTVMHRPVFSRHPDAIRDPMTEGAFLIGLADQWWTVLHIMTSNPHTDYW